MKKLMIVLLMLYLLAPPEMASAANVSIPDLTADTTPTSDDLMITFDSTGSVPRERKVTLGNLPKAWGTTSTYLGYVDPTSSIQTQLNSKSSTAHNHTGIYEPAFTTLGLAKGGTNATSFTSLQLIRMNVGGTALESSGYAITDLSLSGHTHAGVYQPLNSNLTTIGGLACGLNQIAKWSGAAWVCDDDDTGISTGYQTIQEEGSGLTQRTILNFIGGGFTAADEPGNSRTNLSLDADLNTIAGLTCSDNQIMKKSGGSWACAADDTGAGGGYVTILEEGGSLTQRSTMNFVGSGITAADNVGATRTDITIATILNAITDLATTGLVARTGAGTVAVRTIIGDTEIVVSNGDGVSGNPTLSIGSGITRDTELTTHAGLTTGVHGITGTIVGTSETQTLTNKTLTDSTTYFQDDAFNMKKLQFQLSSITAGQTRIVTWQDSNGTVEFTGHTHLASSISDFTEATQDAIGGALTNSSTITWTYNDASNTISAAVVADSAVEKIDVRYNTGGTNVGSRRRLNFIPGANVGITAVDDGTDNEVDITISASAASGYVEVQEEGTPQTARTKLNFIGAGLTAADDAGNTRTNVTVHAMLNLLAGYTDPNADRIIFWDDSENTFASLSVGNSVAITTTTLDTIQDIRTTATPRFAGIGLGEAADANQINATGFHVDVDGNVSGKTFTAAKQTGVAGQVCSYTSYSTDLFGICWEGPDDTMASNLLLKFPNADPVSGQVMIFGTPSAGRSAVTFSTGFSIDPDGNVTVKSLTIPKISGLAGKTLRYLDNTDKVTGVGNKGPTGADLVTSWYFGDPLTAPAADSFIYYGAAAIDGDGDSVARGAFVKKGTFEDAHWCKFTTAGGLACDEDIPAGTITGVGDCSAGACYDGSSDGGTYIRLYDGTSAYDSITGGVRTFTFASSLANSENMIVTLGNNDNTVTLTSSTGALVSISGNAATVTNATLTTALTVNTGTVTLIGNVANTSSLTLPAGSSTLATYTEPGANGPICRTGAGTTGACTSAMAAAFGAATATSLIATGIVDGLANTTICTDGTEDANPAGKMAHIIVNKHATPATALAVTMATPVAGMQLIVKNGQGAGGTNTGVITLVAGTNVVIYNPTTKVNCTATQNLVSGGASGDYVAMVALDTTHWETVGSQGTWACATP